MDTRFELMARGPTLIGGPIERDLAHARCSGYVGRRLSTAGLEVAREVGVIDGRVRGWIDLLAFDRRSGTMFVIEIKTDLDDLGRIERQVGWYERVAWTTDMARSWRPRQLRSWLLVLATAQVDDAIARNREVLAAAFPARGRDAAVPRRSGAERAPYTRPGPHRSATPRPRVAAPEPHRWAPVTRAVSGSPCRGRGVRTSMIDADRSLPVDTVTTNDRGEPTIPPIRRRTGRRTTHLRTDDVDSQRHSRIIRTPRCPRARRQGRRPSCRPRPG